MSDVVMPTTPEELFRPVINKLKAIRDRKTDDKFNMTHWVTIDKNSCGTSACIGGWIEVMFVDPIDKARIYPAAVLSVYPDTRTGTLNNKHPSRKLIDELFYMDQVGHGLGYIDVNENVAIECLEYLIATGNVDWRRAYDTVHGPCEHDEPSTIPGD
jgi:hypothetical protein